MYMKIVTTTNARKSIAAIIDRVQDSGEVFGIGRRNNVQVLLVPFPQEYRKDVSDITNINAYSRSFDFLSEERELYSVDDCKKHHA